MAGPFTEENMANAYREATWRSRMDTRGQSFPQPAPIPQPRQDELLRNQVPAYNLIATLIDMIKGQQKVQPFKEWSPADYGPAAEARHAAKPIFQQAMDRATRPGVYAGMTNEQKKGVLGLGPEMSTPALQAAEEGFVFDQAHSPQTALRDMIASSGDGVRMDRGQRRAALGLAPQAGPGEAGAAPAPLLRATTTGRAAAPSVDPAAASAISPAGVPAGPLSAADTVYAYERATKGPKYEKLYSPDGSSSYQFDIRNPRELAIADRRRGMGWTSDKRASADKAGLWPKNGGSRVDFDLSIPKERAEWDKMRSEGGTSVDPRSGKTTTLRDIATGEEKLFGVGSAQHDAAVSSGKYEEVPTRQEQVRVATFPDIASARKEFNSLSKFYIESRAGFEDALAYAGELAGGEPTAAGDFMLIFSLFRVLDPESTVREGEFDRMSKTGGLSDRMQSRILKITNGRVLADDIRNDFMNKAEAAFDNRMYAQSELEEEYGKVAKTMGVDSEAIVLDHMGRFREGLERKKEEATPGKPAKVATQEDVNRIAEELGTQDGAAIRAELDSQGYGAP